MCEYNSRNRCQIKSSQETLPSWSHLSQDTNQHLPILQRNNEHTLILETVLKVFLLIHHTPQTCFHLSHFIQQVEIAATYGICE